MMKERTDHQFETGFLTHKYYELSVIEFSYILSKIIQILLRSIFYRKLTKITVQLVTVLK